MKGQKKTYGPYALGTRIGSGSYGSVYEAVHSVTGKKFALKIPHLQSGANEEGIKRQIKQLQDMNHPNIVKCEQYFEVGKEKERDRVIVIVLEYCSHGDLFRHRVNVGYVDELICKNIIHSILQPLLAMHDLGKAHRDLKTANILISEDFTLKIADFGFCKDIGSLTQTQCGTPLIMAPEIHMGVPYSKKCDIWSLGVILYELLFKTYPYKVINSTQNRAVNIALLKEQVMTAPLHIPINPPISDQCGDFIKGCLKKKPEERMSAHDLQAHPWFRTGVDRQILVNYFREHFDEPIDSKRFAKMMFDCVKEHVEKILEGTSVSYRHFRDLSEAMETHYPSEKAVHSLIVLMMLKKVTELKDATCEIVFLNNKYVISLKDSHIFASQLDAMASLIKTKQAQLTMPKGQVKIEKDILTWLNKESLRMLQDHTIDSKKATLLSQICSFILYSFENFKVQIDCSSDPMLCALKPVKTNQILACINHETIQESESKETWRFIHSFSSRDRDGREFEIGRAVLLAIKASLIS